MDRAKYWFRRRPATTESAPAALLGCLAAIGAFAQTDTGGAAIPPAFRAFLDSTHSYTAQFVQEIWSDDQRLIDRAQGSVQMQRPGRFRWHYDQPYEQLIVADGETLWMYDVDIEQVTRTSVQAGAAGSPGALLSGDDDLLENFNVVDSVDEADESWVTLAPKDGQGDYVSIRVGFTNVDAVATLALLEFVDGLDQTTVIRFIDPQVNPRLDADLFVFDVPEGAHVLGGSG